MAVALEPRRSAARPDRGDKRDALLRAAIDTFAARGYFNAAGRGRRPRGRRRRRHRLPLLPQQGRPARLDLRADDDGGDRGGAPRDRARFPMPPRGCAASPGSTSTASGAIARWRSCFRSSSGSRRSSWSASRRRSCASISASSGMSSPRVRPPGAFRKDVNPTFAAKLFFGMLDEMATNWILSKRKYSLVSEADAIADLFIAGMLRNRRARARAADRSDGDARIRSAAVLGAGTMGAQIAAHLANAGVPTLLLDVTAQRRGRRTEARARSLAGSLLHARRGGAGSHRRFRHRPRRASHAATGSSRRSSSGSTSSRRCSRRSSGIGRADAIVSSNTSGIPIASLAEGRSDAFRRHFLGTHFFNPPRYLRLLEIIPTADTDPRSSRRSPRSRISASARASSSRRTRRTSSPTASASSASCRSSARWAASLTIDDIDAITGPAIGRPKTATFRTMDLAGLDVLAHVDAEPRRSACTDPAERAAFALPAGRRRVACGRGWIGIQGRTGLLQESAGRHDPDARSADLRVRATQRKVRLPALDAARAIEDPGSAHSHAVPREG